MQPPSPLVSIIIPCWNAERYVLASVLSALAQTHSDVEVIVVDDESTDGSVEALDRVRDRIKLVLTPNRGACSARNTGLEHSSGEFIKFLDADDFLFPEAIELQIAALQKLERDHFTIGRMFRLHQETGTIVPHGKRSSQATLRTDMEALLIDVPVISCALYRRAMIEAIGGFRELRTRQDFDFFVRMVIKGFIPIEDGVPVYVYRDHTSAERVSKRRSEEDYRSMLHLYQSYSDDLHDSEESDASIKRGLAKSCWITGRNALRAGHKQVGEALFGIARDLAPHDYIMGSKGYTALTRLAGPICSERIGLLRAAQRNKGRGRA